MRKTPKESFVESITVQASETKDFVLVPVEFLNSLRYEIDDLRYRLGLPSRQWEPATPVDAVDPHVSSEE